MMNTRVKKICELIAFVTILVLLSGCAKANEGQLSDKNGYDDYGHVLKSGKYIYVDTEGSLPQLRVYNMDTGEDKEAF